MTGRCFKSTVVGVASAALALALAGCGAATDLPTPPPAPASRMEQAPSSDLLLPTVTPITPSTTAGAPSTIPLTPPTEVAQTSYADPVEVARAWMAQWCTTDWREAINANVERASRFQTSAGKAADLAAGDTPDTYQQMVQQRLSSRCDQVNAEISEEAPSGPTQVYVVVTANRTQLADDQPLQVIALTSVRSVLRQPDDQWLVDVEVVAG